MKIYISWWTKENLVTLFQFEFFCWKFEMLFNLHALQLNYWTLNSFENGINLGL